MDKKQVQAEVAYLEMVNDHLMTEFSHLDQMLRQTGFPQGIDSLKLVAQEMIQEKDQELE